jgi:hypothetical protein
MKVTVGLIKLLKKKSTPELVVKYIYKNVFELIKEIQTILKNSNNFLKNKKIIRDLAKNYSVYYEKVINNKKEEWIKTILPPYIHGHRNFYMGVAGRLSFFYHNLEREALNYNDREKRYDLLMDIKYSSTLSEIAEAKKAAAEYLNCNESDFFEKVDLYPWSENTLTMIEPIPNTYYWYGNPDNWSYCYEINFDKNNKIAIRKSQIIILENKPNEEDITADEYDNIEPGEILLVPTENMDNYLYIDNYLYDYLDNFEIDLLWPYSEASCNHIVDQESIDRMMADYKLNVNLKNGYSPEIQEMWAEYNKINEFYKKESIRRKNGKKLYEYKALEDGKSVELKNKFILDYKNKLIKINEDVEKQLEEIPEEDRKNFAIELRQLSKRLNQILKKYEN